MLSVSQQLKDAFNPNNGQGGRYVDYVVSWGVTNQEAQDNAEPSASEAEVSRIVQITNGNTTPVNFANFENDGFSLDGSALVPPKHDELTEAEIGLVFADLSDSNGNFETGQELTIDFPYYYDWLALMINFGTVAASDFTISYYADETEIRTETIEGNTAVAYSDEQAVEGCNKVMISITKIASPYSRARISEITFGTMKQYMKANSESLEIIESIDILNERIPANELKLSVKNFAAEYNIFDPSGIYAYLRTRQLLVPKIGAQQSNNVVGYVNMGMYYLQAPELKNSFNRLELKATDILGVLQDTLYTKGVFKTATLEEFLNDAAADAGIAVDYPESFESITVSAYIPSISHAEAFRRIAQVSNTILYVKRDGVICFKEFDPTVLQTFTSFDYKSDSGLEPSEDSIVNTIEVEAVSYSVSATAETLAEIIGVGEFNVKYDASTNHNITVDGGTLVSAVYYADNAVIEITGGTATIVGKKLTPNIKTVSATNAQANEARLIYSVKDNQFIQLSNAAAVAAHYLDLRAGKRRTVKMQYRGYPYIEMGDCVNYVVGQYLTQPFAVAKNTLNIAGGMTGVLEAREH